MQLKEERLRRGSALGLTRTKSKNSPGGGGSGAGKEEGEFDDLISALRTGDVFGEDMAKLSKVRNRRSRPNAAPGAAQVVLVHGVKSPAASRENGRTTTSRVISRERIGPQSALTNGT